MYEIGKIDLCFLFFTSQNPWVRRHMIYFCACRLCDYLKAFAYTFRPLKFRQLHAQNLSAVQLCSSETICWLLRVYKNIARIEVSQQFRLSQNIVADTDPVGSRGYGRIWILFAKKVKLGFGFRKGQDLKKTGRIRIRS